MKRNACLFVALRFVAFCSYAQGTASAGAGAVSSSIQVSEVNTPTSNIDMLQQSLTKEKQQVSSSQAAAGSAAQSNTQAAKTASSTLEMPINMGGNASSVVKTPGQPRKTVSSAKNFVSRSTRRT